MNIDGDRLSNLPDELIHKILSFLTSKHVVETSVLSSRWRLVWTTIPYLNFSIEDFYSLPRLSKFVTKFLSGHRTEVYSVKLSFHAEIDQTFVKRIMDYAFPHNVEQLSVTCLLMKNIEVPLYLFSSRSLKRLTLKGEQQWSSHMISLTSTWELPALTTLHLQNVALCDGDNDFFSKCACLKSLSLTACWVLKRISIRICHPMLSNLTLEGDLHWHGKINVVAPRLKNLTIINWSRELLISAPQLACFILISYYALDLMHLSTDGFYSLEKVDLCISQASVMDAHKVVHLLEQLHSVKSFTLNMEVVELLSSQAQLISDQPSPFSNLKTLKIHPRNLYLKESPNLSVEVEKYLLDGSPSATFTMVSREEVRVMRDAASAQKHIAELKMLLECEKTKTNEKKKTKRARMYGGKARMRKRRPRGPVLMKMQQPLQAKRALRAMEGETNTRGIILKVRHIEQLLRKLPTSESAKMQECFHTLREEAGTIIDKTINI